MKLDLSHRADDDLLIAFWLLRENCIISDLAEAETFFEKPWKYKEELEELEYDGEEIEVIQ